MANKHNKPEQFYSAKFYPLNTPVRINNIEILRANGVRYLGPIYGQQTDLENPYMYKTEEIDLKV